MGTCLLNLFNLVPDSFIAAGMEPVAKTKSPEGAWVSLFVGGLTLFGLCPSENHL
jgi:hypothetical protein